MQPLRSRSNPGVIPSERSIPASPETRRIGPAGALDVLVVEDDDSVRSVCAGVAESLGCRVYTAASVPDARSLIATTLFDVAFLDLRLPGGTGAELLKDLRAANPRSFVVMMTAFATVSSAVDLMRHGAGDFLPKPFALDQVTAILEQAISLRQRSQSSRALEDRLQAGIASGRIIGQSSGIQKLLRIVSKVAITRHPVLITGERGTGKEVVARAIHANGPHASSPFVPVDCDCIEPSRLETELFGSEPGAAESQGKEGLLAVVREGTIYLGEIGALSLQVQSRLLRTLETKQIRSSAPGGSPVPFTARVLASSSKNLEGRVEQGRFRKDLFYKLAVVNLRVPPLRERAADLASLTEHFLEDHRREHGIDFKFSDGGWESMVGYAWPGNVAELEAMVARACTVSNDHILHFEDLSTQVQNFTSALDAATATAPAILTAPVLTLQEMEKQAIVSTLEHLRGDKIRAAKVLGIGKTTLYRKLKDYGLDHAN